MRVAALVRPRAWRCAGGGWRFAVLGVFLLLLLRRLETLLLQPLLATGDRRRAVEACGVPVGQHELSVCCVATLGLKEGFWRHPTAQLAGALWTLGHALLRVSPVQWWLRSGASVEPVPPTDACLRN